MILATGTGVSLQEYVEYCFNLVNLNYLEHIHVDPNGLNTGVDISVGDPTLANQALGWTATTLWKEIASNMVAHDVSILQEE
jgi:GDPmannose 4,6-dehydratase